MSFDFERLHDGGLSSGDVWDDSGLDVGGNGNVKGGGTRWKW